MAGAAHGAERQRALRAAVEEMERRRDGKVPWDATLAEAFADRADLVLALHARWHRVLAVRLDPLLEQGCSATEVVHAWYAWAAETPGQRAVLDAAAGDPWPMLTAAGTRQDALLAVAAGLAVPGADRRLSAAVWRTALASYRPAPPRASLRERMAAWYARRPCPLRAAAA